MSLFLTKSIKTMKTISFLFFIFTLLIACRNKNADTSRTDVLATNKMTMCRAKTTDIDWYKSDKKAPLFEGLSGIDFPITTANKEAEKYFKQGLMLAYGFNHAEAARSFYQAIKLDSTCAICHWGYAYVLGPNYNGGMENDNYQRAYTASKKALQFVNNCTEKEKALIQALSARYEATPPESRTHLDSAYAVAMKKVYQQFPDDKDISALYVESVMDCHPWDLWAKDGLPKAWTTEILSILEGILAKHPNHAGANHFYIHAVEASLTPERGNKSAEKLATLVPAGGHLVHMPSHIYIRTGDYHNGTLANLKAVEVDSHYFTACHAQGVYPLAYFPHNYHFIAATATLEGNSKNALLGAEKVAEHTDKEVMKNPDWATLQHYFTIPYHIAIKFGLWDKILRLKIPEDTALVYPRAVHFYAQGMAHLGKGEISEAKEALKSLKNLSKDDRLKKLTIWNINSVSDLLDIAQKVLEGEILDSEKKYKESINLLNQAIDIENRLNYNEPPDWFFSVRHHLGAVLLNAKQYAKAEEVYREDLKTYRKNGWALKGLAEALKAQNKLPEADKIQAEFEAAWQWADVHINTSRIK